MSNKRITAIAERNPHSLVWYRLGWSKARTAKNNARYWKWEIEHRGFDPGNK